MSWFDQIMSSDIVYRIGWAIIHSAWQGLAMAAVFGLALVLTPKRASRLRYGCGCLALLAMLGAFCTTAWIAGPRPNAMTAQNPWRAASPPQVQASQIDNEMAITPPAPAIVNTPAAEPAPADTFAAQPEPQPWVHRLTRAVSPWTEYICSAWVIGVFAMSIWNLGGWIAVRRLRMIGTWPPPERLVGVLNELRGRFSIRRTVKLLQSTVVKVPMTIGWLKPVVLIPASILAELSPQHIEAIIAHELAHVRRCDYLVNLLQTVVETLFFHHPAVWWISHRVRLEREYCCDNVVVRLTADQVNYAKALAELAERRDALPQVAVAADGGSLVGRIRRILGLECESSLLRNRSAGWAVVALVFIAAAVAVGIGLRSETLWAAPYKYGATADDGTFQTFQKMIGTWYVNAEKSSGAANVRRIEIKPDATCIRHESAQDDPSPKTFYDHIRLKDNGLVVSGYWGKQSFALTLEGDTMTWTEGNTRFGFQRASKTLPPAADIIVGTWKSVTLTGHLADRYSSITMTFAKDGSGKGASVYPDGRQSENEFTYKRQGDKLYIGTGEPGDEPEEYLCSIEKDRLRLRDNKGLMEFVRAPESNMAEMTPHLIIGQWKSTDVPEAKVKGVEVFVLEFNPDGTGRSAQIGPNGNEVHSEQIVYRIEGDTILSKGPDPDDKWEPIQWRIEGDMLHLTDDGNVYTFARVDEPKPSESTASAGGERVIGTWEAVSFRGEEVKDYAAVTLTFNADGTYLACIKGHDGTEQTKNGAYTFKDGRVYPEDAGSQTVITVAENRLTIVDGDSTVIYRRRPTSTVGTAAAGASAGSLHEAARQDDIEAAKVLLAGGADINAREWGGSVNPPIILAAQAGFVRMVAFLIEQGADVNSQGEAWYTALGVAAAAGHKNIAVMLLDHGAKIEPFGEGKNSALNFVAQKGNVELARILIDRGANVNHRGINDHTPLHNAAEAGYRDMVAFLLSRGADPNIQADYGLTPLFSAYNNNDVEMASMLLRHHADPAIECNGRKIPQAFLLKARAAADRLAEYVVQPGDTLHAISQRLSASTEVPPEEVLAALLALNGLESAAQLRVGQTLNIPTAAPARTAVLPDLDEQPAFVDLATGEMIVMPEGIEKDQNAVRKHLTGLTKGDLGFDQQLLILRGGSASHWDGVSSTAMAPIVHEEFNIRAYDLANIPCRLLVTTGDGKQYDVNALEKTADDGLKIEYRPLGTKVTTPAADSATVINAVDRDHAAQLIAQLKLVRMVMDRYELDEGKRPDLSTGWTPLTEKAGKGPYIKAAPVNPFTGGSSIADDASGDWQYDPAAGTLKGVVPLTAEQARQLKLAVPNDVVVGAPSSANAEQRIEHISFTKDLPIREALPMLAKAFKKNIVPSEGVQGNVPVRDLWNVTLEQVLEAILGTHKYVIDGDFIRVYTEKEYQAQIAHPTDPLSHARAWLSALQRADHAAAMHLCKPGSTEAGASVQLLGSFSFVEATVEQVLLSDKQAAALIGPAKGLGSRTARFGISMEPVSGGWQIRDIDFLPEGKETSFISKFRQANPDARPMVPPTAESIPGAQTGSITAPKDASRRVTYALDKIASVMRYIESQKDGDIGALSGYFDQINEFCDGLQGKNGPAPGRDEWGGLDDAKIEAVLKLLSDIEQTAEGCRELSRGGHKELLDQHWQLLKEQYGRLSDTLRTAAEPDPQKSTKPEGPHDHFVGWYRLNKEIVFPILKRDGTFYSACRGMEVPFKQTAEGLQWALEPSGMAGTTIGRFPGTSQYYLKNMDRESIHHLEESGANPLGFGKEQPITRIDEPAGLLDTAAPAPKNLNDFVGWYQPGWFPYYRFQLRKDGDKYFWDEQDMGHTAGQWISRAELRELTPLIDGLGLTGFDRNNEHRLIYNDALKRFELVNVKTIPQAVRMPLSRLPQPTADTEAPAARPAIVIGIPVWH